MAARALPRTLRRGGKGDQEQNNYHFSEQTFLPVVDVRLGTLRRVPWLEPDGDGFPRAMLDKLPNMKLRKLGEPMH